MAKLIGDIATRQIKEPANGIVEAPKSKRPKKAKK